MSRKIDQKKTAYFNRLLQLVEEYPYILIVNADNVGSNQMQQIRSALRGKAEILMGKNTMMKKALTGQVKKNPKLNDLLPWIRGNIGFVFTKEDVREVREIILSNKVAAPARQGAIAPCKVIVPAGNTGLEPTMTSFFQALNIATRIQKGTVEISKDVILLEPGDKVGSSEATLLQKLGIKPFSYGLKVRAIYENGFIYSPIILDLTEEDYEDFYKTALEKIAAISMQTNVPSYPSVQHSIINTFKNILAVSLATDYTIPETTQMKEFIENPEAFASNVAVVPAEAAAAAAEEEKEPEPEEESDEDMGFGLFD